MLGADAQPNLSSRGKVGQELAAFLKASQRRPHFGRHTGQKRMGRPQPPGIGKLAFVDIQCPFANRNRFSVQRVVRGQATAQEHTADHDPGVGQGIEVSGRPIGEGNDIDPTKAKRCRLPDGILEGQGERSEAGGKVHRRSHVGGR
jgi:hypothetical protein